MSFLTTESSDYGFAVSVSNEDLELKKKVMDCFNLTYETEEEIFDCMNTFSPNYKADFAEYEYLVTDSVHKAEDKAVPSDSLFLMYDYLFPGTYMVENAGEWDFEYTYRSEEDDDEDFWEDDDEDDDEDDEEDDEDDFGDDEDEISEMSGSKCVLLYDPQKKAKLEQTLSWHEVFDRGGGSNGVDISFEESTEVKLDSSISFDNIIEYVRAQAEQKGYQDVVDLIETRKNAGAY